MSQQFLGMWVERDAYSGEVNRQLSNRSIAPLTIRSAQQGRPMAMITLIHAIMENFPGICQQGDSSGFLKPTYRVLRAFALGLNVLGNHSRDLTAFERQATLYAIHLIQNLHPSSLETVISLASNYGNLLWKWLVFACLKSRDKNHDTAEHFLLAIRLALFFLEGVCCPLTEWRAVMERLLRMWLRDHRPGVDVLASGAVGSLHAILVQPQSRHAKFDPCISMSKIARQIGSTPERVMDSAINRLQSSTKEDLYARITLLSALLPSVTTKTSLTPGPTNFECLFTQHTSDGFKVVIDKLQCALNLPLHGQILLPIPDAIVQSDVITSGLLILNNILCMARTLSIFAQAIRAGLLTVLLVSSMPHFYDQLSDKGQGLLSLLIKALTPYLVFQSFRKDVEHALKRHYERGHGCSDCKRSLGCINCAECTGSALCKDCLILNACSTRSCKGCSGCSCSLFATLRESSKPLVEWQSFTSLLQRTMVVQDVIRHQKKFSEAVACANPMCTRTGNRLDFQRCTRCYSALYCSTNCQALHWSHYGHNQQCKEISNFNETSGLDPRDLNFLSRYACEESRKLVRERKGVATGQEQGIYLDLTRSSLQFNFFDPSTEGNIDDECIEITHGIIQNECLDNALSLAGATRLTVHLAYEVGLKRRVLNIKGVHFPESTLEGEECICYEAYPPTVRRHLEDLKRTFYDGKTLSMHCPCHDRHN